MSSQAEIDRVKTLVAKADPKNGGTASERAAALEMANKLKKKYGLTKEDLLGSAPKPQARSSGYPHDYFYYDVPIGITDDPAFRDFLARFLRIQDRVTFWSARECRFYSGTKENLETIRGICERIRNASLIRAENRRMRQEAERKAHQEKIDRIDRYTKYVIQASLTGALFVMVWAIGANIL